MESVVDVNSLLRVFDVLGLFAFAVSGALVAIERDFDVVGIVLLAPHWRAGPWRGGRARRV